MCKTFNFTRVVIVLVTLFLSVSQLSARSSDQPSSKNKDVNLQQISENTDAYPQTNKTLVIIDGAIYTNPTIIIDPEKIEATNLLQASELIKKYGNSEKQDAIEMTTKTKNDYISTDMLRYMADELSLDFDNTVLIVTNTRGAKTQITAKEAQEYWKNIQPHHIESVRPDSYEYNSQKHAVLVIYIDENLSENDEDFTEGEEVEFEELKFISIEIEPRFKVGSYNDFTQWVNHNVRYPAIAQENRIEGRVIVEFVVTKDGSVSGAKVVRGVDPSLDNEALRVIRNSPRWIPGNINGNPVDHSFLQIIVFRLQN